MVKWLSKQSFSELFISGFTATVVVYINQEKSKRNVKFLLDCSFSSIRRLLS